MFKMVTWGQYLGGVALLLVLYYAYVGLVYYRAELRGLFAGKGRGAGASPPVSAPGSLLGQSSLIGKPAVMLSAPPAEVPEPGAITPPEAGKPDAEAGNQERAADQAEPPAATGQPAAMEPAAVEVPALDLPSAEGNSNNKNEEGILLAAYDEKVIVFTEERDAGSLPGVERGVKSAPADVEPDFTVGVAQLNDYFKRAAAGELAPEQLVEQEPSLENTDLLVAFFKSTSQTAQRLTAQRYASVGGAGD